MKAEVYELLKGNLGPLVFILIAGALCLLLPSESRNEAVFLVIGAALTRVKRIYPSKKEE